MERGRKMITKYEMRADARAGLPAAGKAGRSAFSLVELLIVIGILAMLMSILLPTLAKARESANRTACAANLRNWGYAAHAFAAEHKGNFPPAYRHFSGAPFPSVFKVDDGIYRPDGRPDARPGVRRGPVDMSVWRRQGVSFDTLSTYGIQRGDLPPPDEFGCYIVELEPAAAVGSNLVCPSSASTIIAMAPPELMYDNVVWGHYMYVGGLRAETLPAHVPEQTRWAGKEPAVTVHDKNLAHRVLAADEVFYSGGRTYVWDLTASYRINHTRPPQGLPWDDDDYEDDGPRPDWQNILYGDGHVEGVNGRVAFPDPLDVKNYTVYHWFNGGYFYWGDGPKPE